MKTIKLFFLSCIAFTNVYSQDGQLDLTFGTNGQYSNSFGFTGVYPQVKFCTSFNNINIGFMGTYNNGFSLGSFQLLQDGTLNTGLYNAGIDIQEIQSMSLANDGYMCSVVVNQNKSAVYSLMNFLDTSILTKVLNNGEFDPNFGNWFGNLTRVEPYNVNNEQSYIANRLKVNNQEKIIVIGDFTTGTNGAFVNQYTLNGISDSSFNTNGYRYFNFTGALPSISARDLNFNNDNSMVIIGYGSPLTGKHLFLYKLLADGTVDSTFGSNGFVSSQKGTNDTYGWGIYPNNDGSLTTIISVLESGVYNFYTSKYSSTGVLDTTYGNSGYALIDSYNSNYTEAHVRDSNNKLLIGLGNKIYRILPNGMVDSTFGTNGFFSNTTDIADINIKDNNKIVLSGSNGLAVQITQLTSNTLTNTNYNTNSNIIYPNPTSTYIHIPNTTKSIQIIDITGKSLILFDNLNYHEINVENLEKGNYFLLMKNFDGNVTTSKFIKM